MKSPLIDLAFPCDWQAKILPVHPAILPARHFVYPIQVEEVEYGALEIFVRPGPSKGAPFLATCALGFRDPAVPTGIWSTPDPDKMCAVSGGYAYIIDTSAPDRFTMIQYRPVLQVHSAKHARLLLFVSNRTILAWGERGDAWQSPRLSDEGIVVSSIENNTLRGLGWNMMTDKESPFALDLREGVLIAQ